MSFFLPRFSYFSLFPLFSLLLFTPFSVITISFINFSFIKRNFELCRSSLYDFYFFPPLPYPTILFLGLSRCKLNEGLLTKAIKQQEKLHDLEAARGMLSVLRHESIDKVLQGSRMSND